MVSNVTSLTNNGLRDWLIQRVSALVLAAYTVFLIIFYCSHHHLNYIEWHSLFSNSVMRIASSIVLFNLVLHSWIGFWTVTTDYLKPTALRISVQMIIVIALLALLLWGIAIFWGIR